MADSPIISVLAQHRDRYFSGSKPLEGADSESPAADTDGGNDSDESATTPEASARGRMAAQNGALITRETPEEWYIRMGIL